MADARANFEIVLSAKSTGEAILQAAGQQIGNVSAATRDMQIQFVEASKRALQLEERAKKTGDTLDQMKADKAADNVAELRKRLDEGAASADKFGKALEDGSQSTFSLTNGLKMAGAAAAGFLAAQVAAGFSQKLTGFVSDALSAASELEQSIGGMHSVFKENAEQMLAWGQTAATQAGLSKNAFNELAAPLGAMLKSAGFSMDEVSSKTIDLTKRAADMAATFGGPVEDAMNAISSLIRGETNPIERYGVAIKQTDVNLRALADTGKKSTEDLTAMELQQARLALLFEQTADSQGQFAREANTAAGAAERLRAKQENLSAQIGGYLLPLQLKWTQAKVAFTEVLVTKVLPVLEALVARVMPSIRSAIDDVVKFIQQHWPTISVVINAVVENIKTRVSGALQMWVGLYEAFRSLIKFWVAIVHGDWAKAWQAFKDYASAGAKIAVGAILNAFGTLPNMLIAIVEKAINGVLSGLSKLSGRLNVPGIGNVNPLSGLNLGAVSLPRLAGVDLGLEKLANTISDLSDRADSATPSVGGLSLSLGEAGAESGAAAVAVEGAGKAASTAAEKVLTLTEALKDGIISYAEALELKMSAAAAGAHEATAALVAQWQAAEEEAFNFEKTIAKLSEMFVAARHAGEEMVRTLARETMEKLKSAASSLLGQQTREQADLQLQIANVDLALAGFKAGGAPDEALKRFQDLRDHLQAQLTFELARTNVLKAQADQANQTLLTAAQQEMAAAELTVAIRDTSFWMRQNVNDWRDLHPELRAALTAFRDLRAILESFNGINFDVRVATAVRNTALAGGFAGVLATP
mgnify:CR=1 FL=1